MDIRDYVHNRVLETPILASAYTRDSAGRKFNTRWEFMKLRFLVDNFINDKKPVNNFIVFSGLRGIGKTTLLMQLYEYLIGIQKIEKSHVLYVSADEIHSYLGQGLSSILNAYFEQELKTTPISLKDKVFIFVDEAHFDRDWNPTIKALTDLSKNIFVIATGSSAIMLESTTDSARRITREYLFPLTFSEYQILHNDKFFPPENLASDIRGLIISGKSDYIPLINSKADRLTRIYGARNLDIAKEIRSYFELGGFSFTMERNNREAYRKLMEIFDRVIKNDLTAFRAFDTSILTKVFRLLGLIATKYSDISHVKLAKELDMSPDTVNTVLDTLEKTQLIFSIKPMPSPEGKVWSGSPWKYYFLSPTLTYALRYTVGKTTFDDETNGFLWENLAAATLYRLSTVVSRQISLHYDREDNGVDFLLQDDLTGKIIPIEIGLNKEKGQVEKAIEKFKCDYGILISNFDKTFINNKVIHIPCNTFIFA